MKSLHIDFETYGDGLKEEGLDNYACNPDNGVHCLGYAFGDEPVELLNFHTEKFADDHPVLLHVAAGGEVVAHNAAFELAIWNNICVPRYGWSPLRVEQCRCTMAQAYSMSLPGSLEKAALALGIENKKDKSGQLLMLQLARRRYNGTFWTPEQNPEKFEKLFAYCKQDVEVERELDARMMHLSSKEQALWVMDYKINQRGVYVDVQSIEKALALVESEKARLDAAMLAITDGVVGRCTEVQLLIKWIRSRGVEINGVAKADVLDAMAGDLPREVRVALALRKEAAKSSTAKLMAMRERASADNRVRGTLQFHGASTGRWSGRGIQVQNYPRPRPTTTKAHIADMFAHLDSRDYIDINYGPVLDALADCLRGMITAAPGHELVAMDFSAIEARVLAWLAGEEKVLDVFRGHGKIYEHAAAGIYQKPIEQITKDERQIGKVAVLALGYGGGVGAFQAMARGYGVKVDDARADEIKVAWRESHRNIVRYWYELEQAAIDAVELGVVTKAGKGKRVVTFKKAGSFLWCRLPSGRVLCYPYPRVGPRETPWGETKQALHFWAVNAMTNHWGEIATYGGSLAENVTQAVAACLLRESIVACEENNLPIVFHAHDEIVVEVPTERAERAEVEVEHLMSRVPGWATGLPLAAEGWRGFRYRK